MRDRTRIGLGTTVVILGVACLAAAAVLYWAVVPGKEKVPADTNVTRDFSGTAKILLNPQAISSGNLQQAVRVNTPVTAQRNVQVLATSGDAAQVRDTRTLQIANGPTVGSTQATYAVDRHTLQAASSHPPSWDVIPHQGLTVSWPFGAEKTDYTGWVNETQTTTPLKYVREETRQGIDTYVYQADAAPQPIKDQQVLSGLPQALPASALSALGSVLPIPGDIRSLLSQALPGITQPVPLTYTYQATATYWVAPTTGQIVDLQREEIRKAGLGLPGGRSVPAVLPIYDVATSYTDASVNAAAQDAKDKSNTLQLYGTTLPLILLGVGVALLIVAGLVFFLPQLRAAPQGPGQPPQAGPGGPGEPPGPTQPGPGGLDQPPDDQPPPGSDEPGPPDEPPPRSP